MMKQNEMKRNERDWAGQLVSWIKSAIESRTTIFQDVTNDTSVKMESGRTKFPDILLFIDKVSGVVFNGWELKFPDTTVDDVDMLENALEKAKKLCSDSFVTWNGAEAIIWKIDTDHYSVDTLTELKHYPKVPTITTRDDLAVPESYVRHEEILRKRANDILHDLDQLYRDRELKPALNISGNIIQAIRHANNIIVPLFRQAIIDKRTTDKVFRQEFGKWKIYESSTLKILASSSRKNETVDVESVLAKFTFYNLIGKIIFYLTLSENLSGELETMELDKDVSMKEQLNEYFDKAKAIDYQAIFKPYFTDDIVFPQIVNDALFQLMQVLLDFDFRVLPTQVIGNILENLVPDDEKQKFGQYFTPERLANLVAFPVVQTRNSVLFDPTSGTGTFLNAFYNILRYYGNDAHSSLLSQIWGNDVSHFPAILSVINLYKQDVTQTDNFPRVMRDDFFQLEVGKEVMFPDSHDHHKHISIAIPLFDGIASNFPFIQQEDIPNEKLTAFFRGKFENQQQAFLNDKNFRINERSDYFTYCTYNAIRFLKEDGCLSAITSNAWLGKEYGIQFKKFLLDNFHIKYVVKSNAEHWFSDSQVSTIFFVLEKCINDEPTKFVTLNFKLAEYFNQDEMHAQLKQIEEFYNDIDNCECDYNTDWERDAVFSDLYKQTAGKMSVCIVNKAALQKSIEENDSWEKFFVSSHLFEDFDTCLVQYHPHILKVFRGERTGWNDMFVIPTKQIRASRVASKYLIPYVKSPSELQQIEFNGEYENNAFVCTDNINTIDVGTKSWINKFKDNFNKNGSKTIQQACSSHRPYWYSLSPKKAHIITAINPYERFFFTYSVIPFTIDQRLIAMEVQSGYDIELIAALLNSVITFLILEIRGTSRNLGALDLNANYLKQLRTLNPDMISEDDKQRIIQAFQPLKHRVVKSILEEIKMTDRRNFDKVVLQAYGIDVGLLSSVYGLLANSVENRISMMDK